MSWLGCSSAPSRLSTQHTVPLDPSTATAIFLGVGADIPGYDAHIVSASLEYRF